MTMNGSAEQRCRIDDPARFGKVAVLLGGNSAEREVSLMTGKAVLDGLLRRGVDARAVDARDDYFNTLLSGGFDRVWIALHGRGGEDGTVQGLLCALGIPFTGSGVLGSALSMDKVSAKQLLEGAGFDTPRYWILNGADDFSAAVDVLGLPLMIKPAAEGSSIGLTRVDRDDQLPAAYETAARYRCRVIAEQWITGPEYTAAILQGRSLPLIRISATNAFYDYEAKYFSDSTRYICPCGLPDHREQQLRTWACEAFSTIGGSGWGRVDFMLGADERPLIIDVNTVPGMTAHSLVPMAAAEAGIDFDELVWRILETSCSVESSAIESRETTHAS